MVQANIDKTQLEIEDFRLRAKAMGAELKVSEVWVREAENEANNSRGQANEVVAVLEVQRTSKKEKQANFLLSKEFQQTLNDKSYY